MAKPKILVADDDELTRNLLVQSLESEFQTRAAQNGREALELVKDKPDLLLLDLVMPDLDGFEVLRAIREDSRYRDLKVIILTGVSGNDQEIQSLELGAVDFLTKPVDLRVLHARIWRHLGFCKRPKPSATDLPIIKMLNRLVELRDHATAHHINRVSQYAKSIAVHMGKPPAYSLRLYHAAAVHDLGKVAVPDSVLKKPGKLTEHERGIMEAHSELGANILSHYQSKTMQMGYRIALAHHEKWNGTGYPHELEEDRIPESARIVAIADVFDALISNRPYKPPWALQKAVAYIEDHAGVFFCPRAVAGFSEALPEIITDIGSASNAL